jgi:hypothetical protein
MPAKIAMANGNKRPTTDQIQHLVPTSPSVSKKETHQNAARAKTKIA